MRGCFPLYQGEKPTRQPIRARYLGHVTGYQPIRDQGKLIRDVISPPLLWMKVGALSRGSVGSLWCPDEVPTYSIELHIADETPQICSTAITPISCLCDIHFSLQLLPTPRLT